MSQPHPRTLLELVPSQKLATLEGSRNLEFFLLSKAYLTLSSSRGLKGKAKPLLETALGWAIPLLRQAIQWKNFKAERT